MTRKVLRNTKELSDILLFSGTNLYLSFPQYSAFTQEFNDYRTVLAFLYEPSKAIYDIAFKDKSKFLQYFDSFLDFKLLNIVPKRGFKYYYKFKKYLIPYLYKINPIAIISCSDMLYTDRLLFSWCRKNKRPFIIIQPSFIERTIPIIHRSVQIAKYIIYNKILRNPLYRKQDIRFGDESHKNYLLLWSKYFLENSKRKHLNFTGNPAFDDIFTNFSSNRIIKRNILICTQPLDELFKQNVDDLHDIYINAIKSKPDLTFYIKIHPREPLHKYDKIYNKNDLPNIKIIKDLDLYDLFKICDVHISTASFTTFEAAAFGIPVITVNPNNRFKFRDHYRGEINLHITKKGELAKAIERALNDEYWEKFKIRREKYFQKILHSTDGKSAKRVANAIREIIEIKKHF